MNSLMDPQQQSDATPVEDRIISRFSRGTSALVFMPESTDDERTTPAWHPTAWRSLFRWFVEKQPDGFEATIHQIIELIAGDESDEYGILRPTQFSIERVTIVLSRAYTTAMMRHPSGGFPRGSVTTDEAGGIRIEWVADGGAVRLVIPSQEGGQEYIYYERGEDYGTDKVSGRSLADRLQKLF